MPIVSLLSKKTEETREFEVQDKEIIFDALDNCGEKLPHGCLAGSCGACRIEVLEGSENLKPPSAVERNTIEAISDQYEKKNGFGSLKGRVVRLACRARVLGNVKITPLR